MASIKNPAPDEFEEPVPQPQGNPLTKYYRVPGLHVSLPTGGAYMPPGSIEFSMNGDLAVYPMRSADEMLLKSPDALMNGYAIESLIVSCVPGIKAPRLVSSVDLDVLLLAIRAATYGEVLSISPVCPECGAENQTHRNLSYLLSTAKPVPQEISVRLSDEIMVYMRPYSLEHATKLGIIAFQATREVQAVDGASEEIKAKKVNEGMRKVIGATMEVLADCILQVVIPDGAVSDPKYIREFIANVPKPWVDKLQTEIEKINSLGISKEYDVKCAACKHEWEAEIEFDAASFFGGGSSQ